MATPVPGAASSGSEESFAERGQIARDSAEQAETLL